MIDETSPIVSPDPTGLETGQQPHARIVVCVDPVIQAPVQSQTGIYTNKFPWNRRFAEIYTEDSIGRYTVDYSKFTTR